MSSLFFSTVYVQVMVCFLKILARNIVSVINTHEGDVLKKEKNSSVCIQTSQILIQITHLIAGI